MQLSGDRRADRDAVAGAARIARVAVRARYAPSPPRLGARVDHVPDHLCASFEDPERKRNGSCCTYAEAHADVGERLPDRAALRAARPLAPVAQVVGPVTAGRAASLSAIRELASGTAKGCSRVPLAAVRPAVRRRPKAAFLSVRGLVVRGDVPMPDVGDAAVRVEQRLRDADDSGVA